MQLDPLVTDYIKGIASLGATFIRIQNGGKAPARRFSAYRDNWGRRGTDFALDLLAKGKRVGWVLGYGFWILDADSKAEVRKVQSYLKRHRIVTPRIDTPSGGAHFVFAYPADFRTERLKAHVCHPTVNGRPLKVDFKLAFFTYCLAPGTTTEKGRYSPVVPWCDPAPIDPSVFAPGVAWEHPDAKWEGSCDWEDRSSTQEEVDTRQWLPAQRDEMTRIIRAKNVLTSYRPAVDGKGGRRVLANIAVHLRQYLGLSVNRSLRLLREDWNNRCLPPWSDKELTEALNATDGKVPAAGVKEFQESEKKRLLEDRISRVIFSAKTFTGNAGVRLEKLVRLMELGGHKVTAVDLGRRLASAGVPTVRVGRSKVTTIPNLDFQIVGYTAVFKTFKTFEVIRYEQIVGRA